MDQEPPAMNDIAGVVAQASFSMHFLFVCLYAAVLVVVFTFSLCSFAQHLHALSKYICGLAGVSMSIQAETGGLLHSSNLSLFVDEIADYRRVPEVFLPLIGENGGNCQAVNQRIKCKVCGFQTRFDFPAPDSPLFSSADPRGAAAPGSGRRYVCSLLPEKLREYARPGDRSHACPQHGP